VHKHPGETRKTAARDPIMVTAGEVIAEKQEMAARMRYESGLGFAFTYLQVHNGRFKIGVRITIRTVGSDSVAESLVPYHLLSLQDVEHMAQPL